MACNYRHLGHSLADSWFHIDQLASESDSPERIIPDCTPGLMYVRRGQIIRSDTYGRTEMCREDNVYLFGQKRRAVQYHYDGATEAFGVKLMPGSLFAVFGIAAGEITDSVVDIRDLGKDAEIYRQCLIDRNVMLKPSDSNTTPDTVLQCLHKIHMSNGLDSIRTIANGVGSSYKQLERLFNQHVGLSPKHYARMVRFNRSIQIGMRGISTLTDLAYQCGYADQNHFIKETKYFSGKVPGEIFGKSNGEFERNHLAYLGSRAF